MSDDRFDQSDVREIVHSAISESDEKWNERIEKIYDKLEEYQRELSKNYVTKESFKEHKDEKREQIDKLEATIENRYATKSDLRALRKALQPWQALGKNVVTTIIVSVLLAVLGLVLVQNI